MPAQTHGPSAEAGSAGVRCKMIEQTADLVDDLRHRGNGRERVFHQHDIEAASERPARDEREVFLRAVAAVDADKGRRVGPAARQPVEPLTRLHAVVDVALTGHRAIKRVAVSLKSRQRVPGKSAAALTLLQAVSSVARSMPR